MTVTIPTLTRSSRRRRGSTYFLVLMATTVVVAIGLSGVLLARVEMRTTRNSTDWQGATLLAYAAVDHALTAVDGLPGWRGTLGNEIPIPPITLGDGTISWMLADQVDNDLDDNSSDPVRIHGIGHLGEATRVVSVVAFPSGAGLDVLRAAVHADGDLRVLHGAMVRRGPASSNAELRVDTDMLLSGSVEALTLDNQGIISGTTTVPALPKSMPAEALYEIYKTMATKINFPTDGFLENGLVSASINSFGSELNPSGLYYIDVNGSTTNPKKLTIRDCRIVGTLIVKLKARSSIEIGDGVVWEPSSPAYPSLIVWADSDDNTDVTIGGRGVLSESITATNFNPPGLPYNGEPGDTDTLDEYDSVLRGVFHVIRKAALPASATIIDGSDRIVGCVIVEGDLDLENAPNIEADARLLLTPPLGYSTGTEMAPLAGTWQWEQAP